ncbi:MAG: SHOCT domain-containing protein [Desulfobacteraceae bacterium]
MLRRPFLLGLSLGLLLAVSSSAHALMLHDSSRLAMYSAEAEPGSRNSHPARIETDQLLDALARVRARSGETGEVIDLFPKKNREQMAGRLAKEMRRLEPGEELHLVSFRHIGSLFSTKRHASSARVFVEDGRLNLIFGQIDLIYSEFRDPQRPVPPMGSRKAAAALKGEIMPAEGVSLVDGRKDWVALSLVQATQPPHMAAPPSPAVTPPPQPAAAPASKEVDNAPSPKSPESAIAPTEKSIEEKLQILKNLREKELITEEEYVEKKREILDDL